MSKIWVMGDIHGAYKGLMQCLERSNFNKKEDTLIQLGDVVDGWSEVYECVEELLTIPNFIGIKGNHDEWFNSFLTNNYHPDYWNQGGYATLKSYCDHLDKKYDQKMSGYITNMINDDIPESHRNFFKKQVKYYKDDNYNLFVHGGFNRHLLLKDQTHDTIFWWDRDLWYQAMSFKGITVEPGETEYTFKIKEPLKEIFIGHTATISWKETKPIKACNIYNMDTGAGFDGKLTIMDINTKDCFQSDLVDDLYPEELGRRNYKRKK